MSIKTGGSIEVSARKRLPEAKGVTRIDDPGGHGVGWYARVTYRGETWSKYFADGAHGGTMKAFDKALAWRNAKEKEVGKPRTDRLFAAAHTRSSTGVPGVYKSKESYVVAWSPEPGELRREFVSIREFGEEEALRRAVELRRKRERLVYGRVISSFDQMRRPKRSRSKKASSRKSRRS